MLPAAVLAVIVSAEGVGPTNAKISSVQSNLKKTAAVADAAGTSLASSGKKIERAGVGISKVGKAATKYYATPLLAAGAAAVYFGQKYDKAMLLVETHTDTSQKNLAMYKRTLLDMSASGRYTQGPTELAEGLYHVASDGYKGAKAIDVLSQSAKLAMVGQSGMAETTYAVVSALKNQIKGALTAKETIANLNAIMGAGDTKMNEVTGSMSTGIIPAAKQMGLSFEDVGAALDLLTQRGVPAQQGAYRLAMTFQMLIPHTEKAEEAFERLHLSYYALTNAIKANPQHGLFSAMSLLEEHLEKIEGKDPTHQIKTIEEIFGGGRTSRGAISMLQNLDSLKKTYGRIRTLREETPKKIREAEDAPVNQLKEAWVQVETVLTKMGIQIIPPLVIVLHTLVGGVTALFNIFHNLPVHVQSSILTFIALTVVLAYLIRLTGFFVKSFGLMVQAVGAIIGWFSKETAAIEEVAAAEETLAGTYEATAAAAEASAAAQTAAIEEVAAAQKAANAEAILGMPIGGLRGINSMDALLPEAAATGGQMSLFASSKGAAASSVSTAAAEAVPAAEAGGAGIAGGLASGMALAIPGAIAAVGLANILTSAISGDTNNALKEAGGAAGGALIGGILGSVVPGVGTVAGALAGAGIGSIVSDFIGGSHQELNKAQKAQKGLEHSSKSMADALKKQREAARSFAQAENVTGHAHKSVTVAADHLHQAENKLEKDRRQGHTGADRLLHDTMKIKIATDELSRAKRHLGSAEENQGLKGALNKRILENNVRIQKHAAEASKFALKHAKEEAKNAMFNNAGPNRLAEVGQQWAKAAEASDKANINLKKSFSEGGQYSDKFQKKLEGLVSRQKEVREAVEHTNAEFKKTHPLFPISDFSSQVKKFTSGMDDSKERVVNLKQQMGPFQSETKTQMQKASGDIHNFSKASVNGILKVETVLGGFAGNLGIKGAKFGAHKEAVHKARGGHISMGAASGDSVPAMLEKGEYVLNREAVAKTGIHKLNEINFGLAPRFQLGGAVEIGGANMSVGDEPQILNDLYKLSSAINKTMFVISGYRTPQHSVEVGGFANDPHTKGEAADVGAGSPSRDSMFAVHEKTLRAIGLYRPFYPPSAAEVNHVQLYGKQATGAKGQFEGHVPNIPGMKFSGPGGELKQVGQATLDTAVKMAQSYLKKHTGSSGLGSVATGPVVKMAKEMVGNVWGMGEWSPFNSLEMSEAGWNPRAVNPESGAAGLAQALPPSKYPKGAWPYQGPESAKKQLEWMVGYVKDRYQTPANAWSEHLAKGWYQKGGEVEKGIGSTLHGLGEGKHLPLFHSKLKKINRQISKIDLPKSQMSRLGELTNETEKFGEYSTNAGTLTTSDEETGAITQGIFKGATEGNWLEKELGSLMALRKQVVTSHSVIAQKTLPRVMKLMKHTKERLAKVQAEIRKDEAKKRELAKKIKDLEKAQNDGVQKLEKEKKELERNLSKLQSAKHPDHSKIEAVNAAIKSKNEAIGSTNKGATGQIKKDQEQITAIEKDVKDKTRVEGGAKSLVGTLEERHDSLYKTMASLFTSGGEFEGTGDSFFGLEQIQGKGGSKKADIGNPPPIDEVGGEAFSILSRMKDIGEEMNKKPQSPAGGTDNSELKDLEKEIDLEWRKRFIVSQYQMEQLRNTPSVAATAAVPYAGAFALGGSVVADVGERGAEKLVMPNGSRVVTQAEARSAVSADAGGSLNLTIDELNVYEDGTADVKIGDQTFEAKVNKATKKQGRKSQAITPGGLT
jgi:TP901 family phage tail tape measure protein